MGLAMSLSIAILILMVSLWIERPLDFSAFPMVLLVTTMLRLALNVATTRLILSHGHEGTRAAGNMVGGFADLVMGGDFVIGAVVFIILLDGELHRHFERCHAYRRSGCPLHPRCHPRKADGD